MKLKLVAPHRKNSAERNQKNGFYLNVTHGGCYWVTRLERTYKHLEKKYLLQTGQLIATLCCWILLVRYPGLSFHLV